jgi:3-oxoacyl-(acyl-carrier-protein) synthase
MLTPTAFIQSTHNTVGAQIALMLKCYQYNNTFVHRGFSFESALLDATLLLNENQNKYILAGAVDEITANSHAILTRLGLYKQKNVSNFDLLQSDSKGTMAGEGAAFFLLTNQSSAENNAELNAITTFYKPTDIREIEKNIASFLKRQSIDINSIDLIITGRNGDKRDDEIYNHLDQSIFKGHATIAYKHLCGEYPTATAFALWLATSIIKGHGIPLWASNVNTNHSSIKNVLIYNHYQNIHHSLFLISAC